MFTAPSEIRISSFDSSALPLQVMLRFPPVTLSVSLHAIPLSDEAIVSVPVPLIVRSSLLKMTASVFVSPSELKSPVTDRLSLLPFRVRDTLSAFLT